MSSSPPTIPLAKLTGTHGDVLAVAGLADLLRHPLYGEARIREDAGRFVVEPAAALSDHFFDSLPVDVGYPFVKTSDKVAVPPGAQDPVD